MKKAILGKKLGMTQIFDNNGLVVPVTVVQAGPCYVSQVKTVSNDGYSESYAVQTASQARAEMYGMIRQLLSGTGLVGAY